MKMKKSTMWIIIAVVVVVIAGVFFFMHNKNSNDAEAPSQSEAASPSEEAKPEEKPSEEAKPEEKPSEEAKPSEDAKPEEAKIDYNAADITSWMKSEGDSDENTSKLISIDMVPYGTAGSSLNMASASYGMLELSNAENAMDSFKAYISDMTEIQKDYLSFQWENVYANAKNLLADPENSKALLSDAGVENFDASLFTSEKLDELYNAGVSALEEAGVTNEWKNFSDIEPFALAK